jgi:hypothetical protein
LMVTGMSLASWVAVLCGITAPMGMEAIDG